jgi:hypothetical protein
MGGNVTATNKKTGEEIKADKIDLEKATRQEFIKKFTETFKKINSMYKSKFKAPLWVKESRLDTNELYNGSTSFIMDQSISDEELLKYKTQAGDLDIIVPEESKENLWNLLDSLEGKEIVPGITYHGNNKPTINSIGEQINCLFIAEFGDYKSLAQVDFEFLSVDEEGKPNEMAKFGHSSSFEDAKVKVKAVHHKYLIFAISGSIDVRTDIAIATKTSTPEKLKISKAKGMNVARMLKFNLNKGISVAYERMKDANGEFITHEGKDVYKEIPTGDRSYANTVRQMYQLCFAVIEGNEKDEKKFWSFVGILDLIKENVKDKATIQKIHDRYFDKLFSIKGQPGQILEVGNPQLDHQVKISGYTKFCKDLNIKPDLKGVEEYYNTFETFRGGKLRESFRDLLESIGEI